MRAIGMVREGPNLSSGLDQQFGDMRARIAECARDQVRFGAGAAHRFPASLLAHSLRRVLANGQFVIKSVNRQPCGSYPTGRNNPCVCVVLSLAAVTRSM